MREGFLLIAYWVGVAVGLVGVGAEAFDVNVNVCGAMMGAGGAVIIGALAIHTWLEIRE